MMAWPSIAPLALGDAHFSASDGKWRTLTGPDWDSPITLRPIKNRPQEVYWGTFGVPYPPYPSYWSTRASP